MEKTGLAVGKFAPFHKGHQLVIDRALKRSSNVIILVYSNPDFEMMPSHLRANWIKEIYHDKPASVFVPENPPPNTASALKQREFVKEWLELKLPETSVRTVFGSEAYIAGFAQHLGAAFEIVDANRKQQSTSGTALREALRQLGGQQHEAITTLKTYLHPLVLKSLDLTTNH